MGAKGVDWTCPSTSNLLSKSRLVNTRLCTNEGIGYGIIGELKNYIIPKYSEILLRKTIASLTEFKVIS